ncbi:MAG: toprim domain-containing protein [Myxococcales bacterium]|nr:toprim domain-containing protein [Myxococcales bacterium]
MARIPDQEIERLKKEISLESLAGARGVVLTRTGANLLGLCPFHDDREPSLVITPETNLWHCLGACQAGGSVIDWVMRAEGASFRHAVELLLRGADLGARANQSTAPRHSQRRKLEPLAGLEADEPELLGRVVDHYHAALPKNPEALGYLASRGLEHPELVETFRLGFSDRTLGYRLPSSQLKAGNELRRRLAKLGVLRSTGHEHFRGSVVVPLCDAEGHVVQLYGRKIDDHFSPNHLYLPGPHRGVFNRAGIAGQEEVIVCEALFDAMTFWCAGFRNVTSGYGIEGVTEELLDALEAGGARSAKIAFDRDEAGDRGAEKLSERLAKRGIESYRVVFPRGMDANEYARKVAPTAKSLELVLRQAEWMRGGRRPAASEPENPSLAASPLPEPEPGAPRVEQEREGPSSLETDLGLVELGPDQQEAAEPPAPAAAPAHTVERSGDDLFLVFGERKWRVRSAGRPSASELRVNVLVSDERDGGGFFVDTVDLYSARQRAQFTRHAAEDLSQDEAGLRRELGAIVLELENERKADQAAAQPLSAADAMSEEERAEALALLRDPALAARIVDDLGRAGMVGEETNKLVCYLAATSRKLEEPLAIVIQSASAAGKSSLMEAILALMPEEERVQYSAMTGQSLFYMGGQHLKHKILAIVEEEGAERASYALKLLQSEGELTIASTGKDPTTGRHVTQTYRVEGPVMIVLTTTASEVDEELLNRCLVLSVDEGREQTLAIHARQRRAQTLEGLLDREERVAVRRVHKNAQRLLRPLFVVNPFAPELDFASHVTRTRRDHMKYLTLIRAVTLLFQHQRPLKSTVHRGRRVEYIESTREDVALATKLAQAVLGRSLDELAPQTRRLLGEIEKLVERTMQREGIERRLVRFTQRDVREWTHWGQTQTKVHMKRLEEHEYVIAHRRGPVVLYELACGGDIGRSPVIGEASSTYDVDRSGVGADRSGAAGDRSGGGRASVGPSSRRSLVGHPRDSNGASPANGLERSA